MANTRKSQVESPKSGKGASSRKRESQKGRKHEEEGVHWRLQICDWIWLSGFSGFSDSVVQRFGSEGMGVTSYVLNLIQVRVTNWEGGIWSAVAGHRFGFGGRGVTSYVLNLIQDRVTNGQCSGLGAIQSEVKPLAVHKAG